MLLGWITGRRIAIIIIIMIAAFMYAGLLGAFLAYVRQNDESVHLRQQTIAKCLDAGGHIGPGVTCWHEKPTKELMP
jgi:hypothetical protein